MLPQVPLDFGPRLFEVSCCLRFGRLEFIIEVSRARLCSMVVPFSGDGATRAYMRVSTSMFTWAWWGHFCGGSFEATGLLVKKLACLTAIANQFERVSGLTRYTMDEHSFVTPTPRAHILGTPYL